MTKLPIAKLHYLTQDLDHISHQEMAATACSNGIRWIQLRIKKQSFAACLRIAEAVKDICAPYGATLIINDYVDIAASIGAHGVHLGKKDMPPQQARNILGPDAIIGGTANTAEDVYHLQQSGVDYIGLGPFRFTNTKEQLSPVLGLEGYRSILSGNITTPVIAIGGITPEDIPELLETGIHGIAVAGAINLAADKKAATESFLRLLD